MRGGGRYGTNTVGQSGIENLPHPATGLLYSIVFEVVIPSAGLGVMRALGRACTEPNFRAFSGLLRAFSLQIFCGPQAAA